MKTRFIALLVAAAATASAQLTDYLGPGVLTHGASSIGQRSGQDVDLRFFANVSGVYDTGLLPISVDSNGDITRVEGLYGVEAGIGAYGRHEWRRAVLGLDYKGDYRHYQTNTYYDGSNHQLALGYTYQRSRRVVFDFQALAGTSTLGTSFTSTLSPVYDSVIDQNSLLFDNRLSYVQGGMDVNFLLSSRTSFTAGGNGFQLYRQSKALVGLNGYNVHGSLQHRLSAVTTLGATYERIHYDYPRAFGESNINVIQGQWARQFGRAWVLNLNGGIIQSEVQGQQRVAVDPAITRLLGITSVAQVFYRTNILPALRASVTHNWRYASWTAGYNRGINAGNGLYLTSRQESFDTGFGYTGIRKWSFSVNGYYGTLGSLGQDIRGYRQFSGGTSLTYAVTQALNLSVGYIRRVQDTRGGGDFQRNSSRTQVSIYFSPGDIPISFH